jgi:hypothetical protein
MFPEGFSVVETGFEQGVGGAKPASEGELFRRSTGNLSRFATSPRLCVGPVEVNSPPSPTARPAGTREHRRKTINKIMQTDTYFAEQSAKAAWNTVARDLACLAERWEAEAVACEKAKSAPVA